MHEDDLFLYWDMWKRWEIAGFGDLRLTEEAMPVKGLREKCRETDVGN
jgi:hypothetical protein